MELDPTVWQLPVIGRPPERIGQCGVPRTLAALVWRKPWCSTQEKLQRVAKQNGSWTNTGCLKTISCLLVHCQISANQAVAKFRWAHNTPSILQPADFGEPESWLVHSRIRELFLVTKIIRNLYWSLVATSSMHRIMSHRTTLKKWVAAEGLT